MTSKGLVILLIIAGVLTLAASAVVVSSRRSTSVQDGQRRVFADLMDRVNDVRLIVIRDGQGDLQIEQRDGRWVVPDKADMPADEAKVRQLILRLAELEAVEPKTSNPELYARIGVEDPGPGASSTLLTLSDADGGPLASLILGKTEWRNGRQMRYARKPGEAQSWLVVFESDTGTDGMAWVDKQLTRIDGSRVQSLTITRSDGEEMGLSKSSREQAHFDVAPIPEGRELRSEGAADPLARGLQQLNFEDVRPSGGPRTGPESVFVFQTFDGLVVTMSVDDEDGSHWAILTADGTGEVADPDELAMLKERFNGREFKIATWAFNNLNKSVKDLLKPLPTPEPEEDDSEEPPLGPVIDPGG
ncbi:MAG: hypothetical protein Kow0022_08250 [Phycisphaerales bacterium]